MAKSASFYPSGRPRLTASDDQLAAGLAAGLPVKVAAKNAGTTHRTASRRVKDPSFLARIRILQDRAVSRAVGVLTGNMAKAAGTAVELMGKDYPPTVRLAALSKILEYGFKGKADDVRVELDQLRATIEKAFGDVTSEQQSGDSAPSADGGRGNSPPSPAAAQPIRAVS